MNDIIVVSILFYISIKREFVCSPSAFCFIFDESPKNQRRRKEQKLETTRGERRKIVPKSQSLFLFLSFSLPFRRVTDALSSRHRY